MERLESEIEKELDDTLRRCNKLIHELCLGDPDEAVVLTKERLQSILQCQVRIGEVVSRIETYRTWRLWHKYRDDVFMVS